MKNIIRRLMVFLLVFALFGGVFLIQANALDEETEETTAEEDRSFLLPSSSSFLNGDGINSFGESTSDNSIIYPYSSSTTASPGGNASLSVIISDSVNPSEVSLQWYQGFYDPRTDSFRMEIVEGETSTDLYVTDVQHALYYMCTGTYNGKTESVYFTVYLPGSVTAHSGNGTDYFELEPGSSLTLSVTADYQEDAEIVYLWFRQKWDDQTKEFTNTLIEGETSSSYTVNDESCDFICRVLDLHSGRSDEVSFNVYVNNQFSIMSETYYVSMKLNSTATLKVIPSGINLEGTKYAWYRSSDSSLIEVTESPELTTDSSFEAGYYYCKATDKYGNTDQANFRLAIDNELSASAADNKSSFSVALHGSAELKVVATAIDTSKLTYKWYEYNTGSGNVFLEEGADTYTVEDVTGTKQYYCYVGDQYGNSTSVMFTVGVENHLSVEADGKTSKYVSPGSDVELKVNVSADDMTGMTYEWRGPDGVIEGADTDTYLVKNCTARASYQCLVTDRYGQYKRVSFYIYIDNHFEAKAENENVYVNPHDNAELKIVVSGDDLSKVTYRWVDSDWNTIEGAETDTLTVEDVTKADYYRCEVRDGYGNYNYVNFNVYIENHFKVDADRTYFDIEYNNPVELKVNVTADDWTDMKFVWTRQHYDSDDNWVSETVEGADSDSYLIEHVTEQCYYYVSVTDRYENSDSVSFSISVDNDLRANPLGNTSNVSVPLNGSADLTVVATAKDMSQIKYQWYEEKYNESGNYTYWSQIEGAASDTLTVSNLTRKKNYYCRVSDQFNNNETVWFYVSIENHFKVYAEGDEDIIVSPGDDVKLKVIAEADDMNGITYQWYSHVFGDYGYSLNHINDADTDTLEVKDVQEHLGYSCVVTDAYNNSVTVAFDISIGNDFSVKADGPTSISVKAGDPAVLKVIASAKDMTGLTYEWLDSRGAISGADSDTYTVPSVTGRASYRCRVTDRYKNFNVIYFSVRVENHLNAERVNDYTTYVEYGGSTELKLNVTADDMTDMKYTWELYRESPQGSSWKTLENEKGDTVKVENVTELGEYHCYISDRYGNETSVTFRVAIDNQFEASPVGDTEIYVKPHASAEMKVKVSALDLEGITYVWSGSNGKVSGAVTDTLTVEDVDSYRYYECSVYDRYNNNYSIYFYVYVDNNFKAVADGSSEIKVSEGADAEMKVIATADDEEGIKYEWYRSTYYPQYGYSTYEQIRGADKSSYTAENVKGIQHFYCRVSDKYGSSQTIYFTVRVENHFEAKADGGTYKEVLPHESAVLKVNVTADNMEGITYVWHEGNEVINNSTDSLKLDDITSTQEYYCEVTDAYGNSEIVNFRVVINNNLKVVPDGPDMILVPYNSSAEMKVIATADDMEGLKYEWFREHSSKVGEGPSLKIENVTYRDIYYCMVTDKYNNTYSIPFTVGVQNNLTVKIENGEQITVPYGEELTVKAVVDADDTEDMVLWWYRIEYNPKTGYENMAMLVSGTDTLQAGKQEKASVYQIGVNDRYGNYASANIQVNIENDLSAEAVGETELVVRKHANVPLKVTAKCSDMSTVTYRWYYASRAPYEYLELIDGADKAEYLVEDIQDSNTLVCVVRDQYYNSVSIRFNIIVAEDLDEPVYTWKQTDDGYEVTAMAVDAGGNVIEETVKATYEVLKEPDCVTEGKGRYTAAFTNKKFETQIREVTLPALGHQMVKTEAVPATCEKAGSIEYWTCIRENKIFADEAGTKEIKLEETVVPALGHDWDEGTVTTEPTCEEKGVRTYTCKHDSSHTRTEEIPALGHDYDEGVITKAPTCEEPGVRTYTCKHDSSHIKTEVIPALGHEWGEWVVIKEPTETETGLERRYCTRDESHYQERIIPVIGHVHNFKKIEAKAATCEEAGNIEYWFCEECGLTYLDDKGEEQIQIEDTVIPALGHKWDEGKVTKEPTCTESGVRTYTCQNDSSHTKTEEIPALGHEYELKEWKWSEDNSKAEAIFECKNDKTHTKTEEAKLTVKEEDTTRTITAEVTFEGKTYTDTKTETIKPEPVKDEIIRLAGADRFDTSIKIAEAFMQEKKIDKLDSVILANGINFADALAGSYLSYVKNAPILITWEGMGDYKPYNQINAFIKANVKEGGTVYVLGGEEAVKPQTLTGLEKFKINRLAGDNRFETNLKILEETKVSDQDILVATGMNFADSLSASAVNRPILLVWEQLFDMQKDYLKTLKGNDYYILGGELAVTPGVEKQLKAYGKVTRLAGSDRHETSVLIAETFCPDAESAVLALSTNFPDGLCGGPLASATNAPLILTHDLVKEPAVKHCKKHNITKGYVLGGDGLVGNDTVQAIFNTDAEIIVK